MNRRLPTSPLPVSNPTHIFLRNVPQCTTPGDIRRALMRAEIKGVADVSRLYKHFRPQKKVLITMSLPDYTPDALRAAKDVHILGFPLDVDVVHNRDVVLTSDPKHGDGPSAGVVPGRTVTLAGLPGRSTYAHVRQLLKGFEFEKIIAVPLEHKKFSLYSRFAIEMASESEAQRLRK
ncbi:unnamed protein product [Cyclocybe aegerita]|uniref:RRM domain-containing protein n=1 Tax=Cyclocybe aegerita TaxID=1973307 RepID=A0A8S0XLA3_CYCAE|nr:unnamed protein product [Cyclocybe aegerita]